jgi:hypothetical protein
MQAKELLKWLAGEAGGHVLFGNLFSGLFSKGGEVAAQQVAQGVKQAVRQEARTEAMLLHRLGAFYALDDQGLLGFLQQWQAQAEARRDDFLQRNPDLQDRYERVLGQNAWAAMSDGIGAALKSQQGAQGGRKKGGQQQGGPAYPLADPVRLYIVYLTALGKAAIEADQNPRPQDRSRGDKVFVEEMARLEKTSLGDAAKKAANQVTGVIADFLEALFP